MHLWASQGGSSGQAVGACELSDTEIIIKIEEREKARAAKDFTTSDRKRDELRAAGVDVFVVSVDLAWDANWDLGRLETFHALLGAVMEGLIDGVQGGPPCSTVFANTITGIL